MNMEEIILKTGTALIPEDWIRVPTDVNGNEDFVVVIEMKDADYPHFYFLSETEIVSDKKKKQILSAIATDHPWFRTAVLDKQVKAIWRDRLWLNEAEWSAAPIIDFSSVPDADMPGMIYPFGAKVIRTG